MRRIWLIHSGSHKREFHKQKASLLKSSRNLNFCFAVVSSPLSTPHHFRNKDSLSLLMVTLNYEPVAQQKRKLKDKNLYMPHTPFMLYKEKETTDWRFEGFCPGNGAKNHAVQHSSP